MLVLVNAAMVMGGCRDLFHIARQAQLTGRVSRVASDAGVECTAIALLFGREHSGAAVRPGESVLLHVRMLGSLGVPRRVHARVALRLECPGRERLTTAERQVDLTWRNPPTVDFGDLAPNVAQ